MRVIWDIAFNDLRILFSDRGIWLNLVVIPIVLSVAVALANGAGSVGSGTVRLRVDVLDDDASTHSAELLANIRAANTNLLLCPADNTEDDACELDNSPLTPELAQERLENETSLALIQIPAGFGDAIDTEQPTHIVYRSNEDVTAPSFILQAVQAGTQQMSGAQVAVAVAQDVIGDMSFLQFADEADRQAFTDAVRAEAQTLWANNPVRVEMVQATLQEEAQNSGGTGFQQSIPGMGSMYVLFTVLPATAAFIRERKLWTIQRLVTTPVSRAQILGGKLLARFVMGMIQFAVLFGFGLIVGARFGSDPVAVVALLIAFTLCSTALALALTTLLKTESQAEGIVLFASLTLASTGGAWWPLEIVPEWMRVIGHISPIAWMMDGFHSLTFFGGNLGTVLVPIAVLLAMTAGLFAFGVARFRFN